LPFRMAECTCSSACWWDSTMTTLIKVIEILYIGLALSWRILIAAVSGWCCLLLFAGLFVFVLFRCFACVGKARTLNDGQYLVRYQVLQYQRIMYRRDAGWAQPRIRLSQIFELDLPQRNAVYARQNVLYSTVTMCSIFRARAVIWSLHQPMQNADDDHWWQNMQNNFFFFSIRTGNYELWILCYEQCFESFWLENVFPNSPSWPWYRQPFLHRLSFLFMAFASRILNRPAIPFVYSLTFQIWINQHPVFTSSHTLATENGNDNVNCAMITRRVTRRVLRRATVAATLLRDRIDSF
jgi:hypothetical protein